MSLGRTTILSISAALLSASLLLGCAGSRDAEPPLGRTFDTPAYVLDPSFPRPSWVTFDTVSWVDRDPESNLVYVLQRSAPPVSAWTADGELVSTWTTQVLGDPHSISFDTGPDGSTTVWITDMAPPLLVGQGYGHCLKSFTLSGEFLSTIGTCGENSQGTGLDPVQFDKVTDVAWDAAGNLLVSDGDLNGLNNRVLKLDSSGVVLASWSTPGDQPGSGPAQFDLPHMLIVDRCDRIWVAVAFGASFSSPPETILFVGASPTSGGGTGRISLFAAPMDCTQPTIANLAAFATFDVPIPTSTSTTLLHSMTVDPETWDVYLAVLGGKLPPQKWVPAWPGGERPSPR